MTNTQINQIIHEAMGLCWHEVKEKEYGNCIHCHEDVGWRVAKGTNLNPDYTSDWSDYGKALEWVQMQEWWADFAYKVRQVLPTHHIMALFLREDLLAPRKGSIVFAEFIVEHPKYFKKEVSK